MWGLENHCRRRFDGFRFYEPLHLVVEQFGAAARGFYFVDRTADFVINCFVERIAPSGLKTAVLCFPFPFHSFPVLSLILSSE